MDYKEGNYEPPKLGLGMSVYEASKIRIKECINSFDNIAVAFSGGKDCSAVLYLVDECMKELGREEKVTVLFNDLEFMPSDTLAFVDGLVQSDKYNFYYLCLPTLANVHILGHEESYIQWDPNRDWYRQPPEYAITTEDVGNVLIRKRMSDANRILLRDVKGSVCVFNGFRADESYNVYRGLKNNMGKQYLSKSDISERCWYCKPIYDWSIKDVFLYFLKSGNKYNRLYDWLMWLDLPLRGGIPLDTTVSKYLDKYRMYDPEYINQILKEFPQLDSSSRYNKDISIKEIAKKYGANAKGVVDYVKDTNSNNADRKALLKELKAMIKMRNKRIKEDWDIMGSIPYRRIYMCLVYGYGLGSADLGTNYNQNYSLEDFLFEGFTEEDYLKYKERKGI